MSTKKGVAIVGYGGIGTWHTRHILNSDVVELKGIWDIDEAKRKAAAENGILVYSSYEDLLSDASVELVTVAVPNDVHKPLSIQAMEAGKNVICEKPVTMNLPDLKDMIAASKRAGVVFSTHQNRRWDADFRMMKQVYDSGDLGEVFAIESRVQGSHGIPGDWRKEKEHGGGMLLDWGVHLIDQILQMVEGKKIEQLYCRFDHITNYEVDDGFKLDIHFADGPVARVEVGTSNFITMPRYYMLGTNGSAIVRDWGMDCEVVCCKNWEDKDVVPVVTAAGLTKTMAPRSKDTQTEYTITSVKPDVHDFYRNLCLAIDGKAEQIVTHEQQIRLIRVMEACFESDRLGAPVKFED
ncbi:MAG: Gfo/Idh/MocA family oxidoreductase [Clostridia bacterium]|nr:Gfo/Idh/MocA family oxidoreductase [Clostridia bacterium]